MKLWKITWHDDAEGRCMSWAASRREASKEARAVKDRARAAQANRDPISPMEHGIDNLSIERVEVPTDKVGLIEWLNRNVAKDNG